MQGKNHSLAQTEVLQGHNQDPHPSALLDLIAITAVLLCPVVSCLRSRDDQPALMLQEIRAIVTPEIKCDVRLSLNSWTHLYQRIKDGTTNRVRAGYYRLH